MIEPATARARATNPAGAAAAAATPLEEAVQQFDLVASIAHNTLIEDIERRIVGP